MIYLFTSRLGFDLQNVRGWTVAHRGEAQHPEAVGDVRNQARDGGQAAVICVVLLPGVQWIPHVRAIVDPVTPDLPIRFLGRLPVDQHCAGTQHTRLDVQRWRGRCLFACAGFHGIAGRPPPNVVDCHDPEFVLGEGTEATDAVASGCHTLHLHEAIV